MPGGEVRGSRTPPRQGFWLRGTPRPPGAAKLAEQGPRVKIFFCLLAHGCRLHGTRMDHYGCPGTTMECSQPTDLYSFISCISPRIGYNCTCWKLSWDASRIGGRGFWQEVVIKQSPSRVQTRKGLRKTHGLQQDKIKFLILFLVTNYE